MGERRLNLGCGHDIRAGYINCDLYTPEAEMNFDSSNPPFGENSVDEILAYHIIEHFPYSMALGTLWKWHHILRPGGKLRIETPDMLESCKRFVQGDYNTQRGMLGHFFSEAGDTPGQIHYFLFTEAHLTHELTRTGFKNIKRMNPDSSYVTGPPFLDPKLMLNLEAFK